MEGFAKESFSAPLASGQVVSHDVYSKGSQSSIVVVIQELPGIGPQTLALANMLNDNGFKVVIPHLFGPLGKLAMAGNLARVFCMRKEFHLFSKNKSSPIVDWLRALCQNLKQEHNVEGVGVIGMCLTGNFAMSLIADDAVLAGVASQPSMPIHNQHALHMSNQEIAATKAALDRKGPMMALRFEKDKLCRAEKFTAIEQAFNDGSERVRVTQLPGKGHSVLTLDYRKGGEATKKVFADVISYFKEKL